MKRFTRTHARVYTLAHALRARAFPDRVTNRGIARPFIPYGQHEAAISHISLADTFENLLREPRASRCHPMSPALSRSCPPWIFHPSSNCATRLSDSPPLTEGTSFCRVSARGPRSSFLGFATPKVPVECPRPEDKCRPKLNKPWMIKEHAESWIISRKKWCMAEHLRLSVIWMISCID